MFPKGDRAHIRYLFDRKTHLAYRRLMKTLESSLAYAASDVAQFRLHVLEYYYKWGLRPTLEAFRVKKSTFYDWRLVEFIKEMRLEYGNVGSHIIKPFLDKQAQGLKIKTISLSTIEKIIERRRFTFETRVHYKRKSKYQKLRIKKAPRVTKPGLVQVDSIILYINKERHVFIGLIDIFTKFALVEKVKTTSSLQAREVFKKF